MLETMIEKIERNIIYSYAAIFIYILQNIFKRNLILLNIYVHKILFYVYHGFQFTVIMINM